MVKKAVIAEAKANTQDQSIKDPQEEKPKIWAPELSTPRFTNPESFAKA